MKPDILEELGQFSGFPSREEASGVQELAKEKLRLAKRVLEHPAFDRLIEEGAITLGAIKPHAEISKLGVSRDWYGERILLQLIREPLQVIYTASFLLDSEDVREFYPPELAEKYGQVSWNNYVSIMTSGPVTYCILYEPGSQAVTEWRRQMGATDPEKAETESIRGRYANSVQRNLVHGSSSISEARREMVWLKAKMGRLISPWSVTVGQTIFESF